MKEEIKKGLIVGLIGGLIIWKLNKKEVKI